jgi:hypothetical protein
VQHDAARSSTRRVTLDIDSSESPVHGAQAQSAYNGHFESVCYQYILHLAESHLTRRLSGQILGRIERLAWHPT